VSFPLHLLLPLASSLGYVLAVLLLKRAAAFGVGIWRTTFVSNLAMGACLAPLWGMGGAPLDRGAIWQPMLGGSLFFLGQIGTFVALEKGDVSVATPVLGLKILFVAGLSVLLLPGGVPLLWWVAAGLGTLAIVLLNYRPDRLQPDRHLGITIAAAAGAALAFAATDVLVQRWAPVWGVGRYLPLMFAWVVVLSLGLVPRFSAPLHTVDRIARPWLAAGAVILAVQAALMAFTLGTYGDATAVNIVYAARGLWSVLAVWWVGHWFQNAERHLARAVLRRRLGGALLMLVAIALVLG
jgi:drug/metabolite transporter (DMT)-like permease